MIEVLSFETYDDGYHFTVAPCVRRKLILHDAKLNVNNIDTHVGTCQFIWLIDTIRGSFCSGFAFVSDDKEFQVACNAEDAQKIYDQLNPDLDKNTNKLLL